SATAINNSILTNTATINAVQTDTNSANNTSIVATRVVGGCIPPTIDGQPLDTTNCPASSASFDVIANGSATLRYQWRRNGVDIGNATNSTFTIASASADRKSVV